jgi:hypothetical protein
VLLVVAREYPEPLPGVYGPTEISCVDVITLWWLRFQHDVSRLVDRRYPRVINQTGQDGGTRGHTGAQRVI